MRATDSFMFVWSFLTRLFLAAFALNWVWEMTQMFAYDEMAGRLWRDTALVCTVATFGDAGLTLGAYGVGALVTRRLQWGMSGG